MSVKIGQRVAAVRTKKEGLVELFGYGTYQGKEVPNESCVGLSQQFYREQKEDHRIVLDDGRVIYGGECEWGPEKGLKRWIRNYMPVVTDIDIDAYRKSQWDGALQHFIKGNIKL